MTIIGLNGPAGVGKDEVARIFRQDFDGWRRVAFADPMRDGLYALNPIVMATPGPGFTHYYRLSSLVDAVGWDQAKRHVAEVRELMQRFGTEAGREIHGQTCWLDIAEAAISGPGNVVVTDVRFDNEAELIHKLGGYVWKITRPGVGAVNAHVSDQGLSPHFVDYVLENDGDLNDLAREAHMALLWSTADGCGDD